MSKLLDEFLTWLISVIMSVDAAAVIGDVVSGDVDVGVHFVLFCFCDVFRKCRA